MSAIERDGVDLDGGDPDDTDGDARTGEPGRQWISTTRHPTDATLSGYVDKYFLRTKDCVARFGDKRVTYAVFMRRPVTCTPRLAVDWIQAMAATRGVGFDIELTHRADARVGAGQPMLYINCQLSQSVDLETHYLQKPGPTLPPPS